MLSIIEIPSTIFLLSTCLLVYAGPGGSSPPQILLPPEDIFPLEGNLEFSCKGTGFPEPQISWHDANTRKRLDESASNIHVNQYLGRLTIADPEVKRTYSVYCNISNTAGWVASSVVHGGLAYLEHDFPRFPIDKTVEEGDLVLLECQPPMGNPTPTTEWLYNNAELPPGLGLISPEGDLHIREVKPKHAGTYACRARNIAGKRLSPSAVLRVKRKTLRFLQKPKDTQSTIGATVTFRCRVTDSKPVVWRRGNGEQSLDRSRVQISPTSITIQNVQPSDAGRYICIAADGVSAAEAQLTVLGVSKPTFSRFPTDQNATEGETVVFHCRAANNHKFPTYWDLPNQVTVFPSDPVDNVFVNELGDLQIRGVRLADSGVYQCTVDSELGLITKKARLQVFPRTTKDTTPLPPIINLPPANQTRITGETVLLDCEVGITREPETGFDLTRRDFETSQSNVFWVRGTRSTGGLQERIEFFHRDRDPRFSLLPGGGLQISAVMMEDTGNYTCFLQSSHGPYMQSNWTASLVVLPPDSHLSLVTEPAEPLSPPENLRVLNQTAKSVTLIWSPPIIHDTNGVSYWIEMFHTAEADLGWQVLQESWLRNAIRLEPLQPNSAYYFLIRPRWIEGRIGWASAPLGPIQTQYRHDPSAAGGPGLFKLGGLQVQVLSSTSARVIWSMENPHEVASALKGFSVRYKEVPLTRCISANVYDATFCSLRSGETLTQRIQIYQEQLNTASLRDTQGVSLVPHEEPEMFADFPFDRNHGFASPWTSTLAHLKPFHCYSVLVQPNSIYPIQEKNETTLFLIHEDVPSTPPRIIGVKKQSNHSVEISWTVPTADSWNGLLTGFVVYVFNAAENDKRELKFSYGDTKGVVSGLKAGEIYHLQMTAVNCRGSSSKSIPINFSVSEGGIISDTPPSASTVNGLIQFQPWVIGIVVGVLVIWLLAMFFAVIFCLRQRTQPKQRYPPSVGGGFNEDATRKCSAVVVSKEGYNLVPLIKPHSISGGVSDMECPQGSDSALKAPTASTQQNTTTTIASTNSSSTGGSCNPNINQAQHTYEEGILCQASDFSPSPFFSHITTQHMEYPFVEYRPAEISNNSVFSASVIENSPTTNGLPPVAPVAQLGCTNGTGSGLDHISSSVTPYATASLINAEISQKASIISPGSRTPSDMSSNAGGAHVPMVTMHSPQRYSVRPQQYISRSSSGTTTGAEEDYLSHHHQQQPQQQVARRRTVPMNVATPPQIPPTFTEYELCIPPPPPPPPPPIPQHQLSAQVPANGGIHAPVF
ncbi:roundabout 2 [Echinococcus multilocularis]|uniref:Roundabout 2 n=1 Tax=Echinococcus multilocularis TaxID=6211 RepID=A0A068Y9I9_ECHMU|nr:roundabout 2 [Echinococcus multilocularis]